MKEILVVGAGISGSVISNLHSLDADTRITVVD